MTVAAMAERASPGVATKWTPYAGDLAALIETLNLKGAVLFGFSAGGGGGAREPYRLAVR